LVHTGAQLESHLHGRLAPTGFRRFARPSHASQGGQPSCPRLAARLHSLERRGEVLRHLAAVSRSPFPLLYAAESCVLEEWRRATAALRSVASLWLPDLRKVTKEARNSLGASGTPLPPTLSALLSTASHTPLRVETGTHSHSFPTHSHSFSRIPAHSRSRTSAREPYPPRTAPSVVGMSTSPVIPPTLSALLSTASHTPLRVETGTHFHSFPLILTII
jgi:hypothetical protein